MDDAELIKEQNKKRKRKRNRRMITTAVVIVAVILALSLVIRQLLPEEVEVQTEREARVTANTYSQVIDISGYVEPYDSQTLRFRSTGAVTGVYVEEGDVVVKGQILATIDDTQQQVDLQEIRNQIEEAMLSGSLRELELLRLKEISAEHNLEYATIVAPFDGEVASVDVDEGDYFEGGDEVITVVDRSMLKAVVEIDEIDMQYVSLGQYAELIFESAPESVVSAYVSYIPMLGRYTDQGIGVVDVELLIEDPPEGIMPGFTFEGVMEGEDEVTMLLIPQNAITRGRGDAQTVNVRREDGSVETVSIRSTYLGEGLAQLLSGNLKDGDILVYSTDSSSGGNAMGGGGGGGPAPGGDPPPGGGGGGPM